MKQNILLAICILLLGFLLNAQGKKKSLRPLVPYMGWSSWNNFRVNINEGIIKRQADYMVSTGLKSAGYNFVCIDDGLFGGRNAAGNLIANPKRFPKGLKDVADYIHAKGLKAGIYSDAGINTCGTKWDDDTLSLGTGLFGHDQQDLYLMLNTWGYDCIKVDWCGGKWMRLDEQTRYTTIGNLIRTLKPAVVYNICRWQFPGVWATNLADSWRISGDIDNTFESIMKIVDANADLWKYATPGHINDMDMLQVGRGMTYEEDKTHFTMWCMMNSPLLAGNDLTKMSEKTIEILTNKEIIALNQDPLVYQARRLVDYGDLEIWAKPLGSTMSGIVAVTLLNRSIKTSKMLLQLDSIGIDANKGYSMQDLWLNKKYSITKEKQVLFEVPAHGVVVLKIKGTMLLYNIFQGTDLQKK